MKAEGNYYEIGTDLYHLNYDYSDEEWIGSDCIYITPQGEITSNSAPVNSYGATEFVYRSNYIDYGSMGEIERRVIDLVGTAAVHNNMDSLYDLLDDYTWDMFSFANTHRYTIWNGYKMRIMFRPYENDDDGDCTGLIEVELRAENGIGYIGDIYHSFAVSTEGREHWMDNYRTTD